MAGKLNRAAYQRLINEDIARVVREMKPSPERDHVIHVLTASVNCYYPTPKGPGE